MAVAIAERPRVFRLRRIESGLEGEFAQIGFEQALAIVVVNHAAIENYVAYAEREQVGVALALLFLLLRRWNIVLAILIDVEPHDGLMDFRVVQVPRTM